jgi:hypothetical protein
MLQFSGIIFAAVPLLNMQTAIVAELNAEIVLGMI